MHYLKFFIKTLIIGLCLKRVLSTIARLCHSDEFPTYCIAVLGDCNVVYSGETSYKRQFLLHAWRQRTDTSELPPDSGRADVNLYEIGTGLESDGCTLQPRGNTTLEACDGDTRTHNCSSGGRFLRSFSSPPARFVNSRDATSLNKIYEYHIIKVRFQTMSLHQMSSSSIFDIM